MFDISTCHTFAFKNCILLHVSVTAICVKKSNIINNISTFFLIPLLRDAGPEALMCLTDRSNCHLAAE